MKTLQFLLMTVGTLYDHMNISLGKYQPDTLNFQIPDYVLSAYATQVKAYFLHFNVMYDCGKKRN